MSLPDRISEDMKKAQAAKDALKLSVLRLIKSALHNQEIAKKKKKLSDEEVQQVILSEAKKRKEAIIAFTKGGRNDLLAKERAELTIIEQYLPEQLSEAEVKKIVQEVIASLGDGEKNFGQVMGQVMARVKGQADGKIVSKLVKEVLTSP